MQEPYSWREIKNQRSFSCFFHLVPCRIGGFQGDGKSARYRHLAVPVAWMSSPAFSDNPLL